MSLFNFFSKKQHRDAEPEGADATVIPPQFEDAEATRLASAEELTSGSEKPAQMISSISNLNAAVLTPPSIDHLPDIDDSQQRHHRNHPPSSPFTDVPDIDELQINRSLAPQTPPSTEDNDDRTRVLPRRHRRLETDLGHLIVFEGAHQGKMFSFASDESPVIGTKEDCPIRLEWDPGSSRRHAQISWEDNVFWISDLASTNGTLVNQQEVSKSALADGDKILIGETLLLFKWTRLPQIVHS